MTICQLASLCVLWISIAPISNCNSFIGKTSLNRSELGNETIDFSAHQLLQEQATTDLDRPRTALHPWAVSVQKTDSTHLCTGNIMTSLHVLTTCICVAKPSHLRYVEMVKQNPEHFVVVAGLSKIDLPLMSKLTQGQMRNVSDIFPHAGCNGAHRYNLAVVELEYYLYFTHSVQPLPKLDVRYEPFPSSNWFRSTRDDVAVCRAAGWRIDTFQQVIPGPSELLYTNYILLENTKDCDSIGPRHGSGYEVYCGSPYQSDAWSDDGLTITDTGSALVCGKTHFVGLLSFHRGKLAVFNDIEESLRFVRIFYWQPDHWYNSCSILGSRLIIIVTATLIGHSSPMVY